MWADPAVYGPIGMTLGSREDVWQRLLRYIGHWAVRPYGYWAVRETSTGRFVGEVGIMDSRRETMPSFEGTPEAGWAVAAWAHGHGLAGEAVAAMLAWADAAGVGRTVCMIGPGNQPSLRLAARAGYRFEADIAYLGHPRQLLGRG